ncbi:hypothetical protein [Amycolatopsis japonica]
MTNRTSGGEARRTFSSVELVTSTSGTRMVNGSSASNNQLGLKAPFVASHAAKGAFAPRHTRRPVERAQSSKRQRAAGAVGRKTALA